MTVLPEKEKQQAVRTSDRVSSEVPEVPANLQATPQMSEVFFASSRRPASIEDLETDG
jgi:hypothetical protein